MSADVVVSAAVAVDEWRMQHAVFVAVRAMEH